MFNLIIKNLFLEKKQSSDEINSNESNENLSQIRSDSSIDSKNFPHFDSTYLNVSIRDPMKEIKSNEVSAESLEKEFMVGYIKFIYGLSIENPNLRHSFSSNILLEDAATHNEKPTIAPTTQNQIQLISSASALSMSLSANTSQLTSKANSFFTKTINTVKNRSQSTMDLLDLDMLDDNDNEILVLEQDDTSSLISFSYDTSTTELKKIDSDIKHPSSLSLNSSSSSSIANNAKISSISDKLNLNNISDLNKQMLSSPSTPLLNTPLIVSSESSTQTHQQTMLAKIKLKNILSYIQTDESSLCVMVQLDGLELHNRQSKTKKSEKISRSDILLCFKRQEDNIEAKDGILELIIENLILDIDLPIVVGIGEFVEDNDYSNQPKKATLPVKIIVRNCDFTLLNEPENVEKAINLSVNKILVHKLPTNELVISEFSVDDHCTNKKLKKFNAKKIDYYSFDLNKGFRTLENDLLMAPTKALKKESYVSPDQLASLVFLLRKSREDNFKLQTKLKNEQLKSKDLENDKDRLEKEVERCRIEIETVIKQNIQAKNEPKTLIEDEFVLPEKSEEKIDQLEIERKQFENILRSYQDENDVLKKKMKKMEETVYLLTIERDSLFKKMNLKK